MKKQEVESSVIGAVGHTRVLEIEFENGRIYQYFDVPEEVFEGMVNSDSKGRYFNSHVRGKYDYQEIELKERRKKPARKKPQSANANSPE
jgi:hypothetical protein